MQCAIIKVAMDKILQITEIVLACLLTAAILLQHRGTALGGTFGGEGNIYRSRRGAEQFLFWATIILAVLFVLGAIVSLIW